MDCMNDVIRMCRSNNLQDVNIQIATPNSLIRRTTRTNDPEHPATTMRDEMVLLISKTLKQRENWLSLLISIKTPIAVKILWSPFIFLLSAVGRGLLPLLPLTFSISVDTALIALAWPSLSAPAQSCYTAVLTSSRN